MIFLKKDAGIFLPDLNPKESSTEIQADFGNDEYYYKHKHSIIYVGL